MEQLRALRDGRGRHSGDGIAVDGAEAGANGCPTNFIEPSPCRQERDKGGRTPMRKVGPAPKVIPIAGNVLSVLTGGYDAYQLAKTIQRCW